MPRKPIHLFNQGDVYGKLTVIKELPRIKQGLKHSYRYILCKCECGNEAVVIALNLVKGNTISCGCYSKERRKYVNLKHGMLKTRPYKIWQNMKERCTRIGNKNYHNYGGRGITYDVKREDFQVFWEDMKEGYDDNLTLDREDNNGNYCKDNCRRATRKTQSQNTRETIKYKGKCVSEWAEIKGVDREMIYARIRVLGWDIEKAINTGKHQIREERRLKKISRA